MCCMKAGRSRKAWLTVLISDDRYWPGCNANEPHAIAQQLRRLDACEPVFVELRSPRLSPAIGFLRRAAIGPTSYFSSLSLSHVIITLPGSVLRDTYGNRNNEASILRRDDRSLLRVTRSRVLQIQRRFITLLNKHYIVH